MKFVDLGLSKPILRAVAEEGYETATPIQHRAIPHVLAGRDLLGCAQTGTGKTAAFALPILDRLAAESVGKSRRPRALVLAPTRELAQQIADSFRTYGRRLDLFGTVVYGGVGQHKQVQALRRGVDILVATPGRLLDLVQQGHCDLSAVRSVVLDEADRMMDMGFMPDIKRVIAHLPDRRQTLLFSATMPREIRKLANDLLRDPEQITLAPESPAVERIAQSVYHVEKPAKPALLAHLLETLSVSRAIVFSRTKHGADRIVRHLNKTGSAAAAIHGNKSQRARQAALEQFRSAKCNVLVATDIAARGIDVDGVSHVVNFDVARDPEGHVHRIGRTARAGADGAAITFCEPEERPHLKAIERLLGTKLAVVGDGPRPAPGNADARPAGKKPSRPRRSQRGPKSPAGHRAAPDARPAPKPRRRPKRKNPAA